MSPNKTKNELDLLLEFEHFIRDCCLGRRLQPGGKRISAGTVGNYRYTLYHLRRFSESKEMQLRIRPVRRLNSRELVSERKYWRKFYTGFTNYLYDDCGCYDNYVGQHIKSIKTFFNYLNKERPWYAGEFSALAGLPKLLKSLCWILCAALSLAERSINGLKGV